MKTKVALLIVFLLILTGCWDMKDIEQRSIVLGVGIDSAPEAPEKYRMTVELPIIGGTGASAAGGEGGGGESGGNGASVVTSTLGNNVGDLFTQFEKRFWRRMFTGHIKVLVLGEDLAKEGIHDFIDYFHRDPIIDRRFQLVIAQGDARSVFDTTNPREPIAAVYLNLLLELQSQSARAITQNFQQSLIRLDQTGSTILPRVRGNEEELVVGGAAVIKQHRFVGWLDEQETRAVQFLYDSVRGGRLTVNTPDGTFTYTINTARTSLKPRLTGDQMTMEIAVETEGNIVEYVEHGKAREHITVVEKALNQQLTSEITQTLNKLQKEFRADAIGFLERIKRHEHQYWLENHENWESGAFQDLAFDIQVEMNVRRTGVLH